MPDKYFKDNLKRTRRIPSKNISSEKAIKPTKPVSKKKLSIAEQFPPTKYGLVRLDYKTGIYDLKTGKRYDHLLPPEIRDHGIYNPSPEMEAFKESHITIEDVRAKHSRRSRRAKAIDESKKAKVTTDYKKWMKHPNRYDVKNVDTPYQEGMYDEPAKEAEKLLNPEGVSTKEKELIIVAHVKGDNQRAKHYQPTVFKNFESDTEAKKLQKNLLKSGRYSKVVMKKR